MLFLLPIKILFRDLDMSIFLHTFAAHIMRRNCGCENFKAFQLQLECLFLCACALLPPKSRTAIGFVGACIEGGRAPTPEIGLSRMAVRPAGLCIEGERAPVWRKAEDSTFVEKELFGKRMFC